MHSHDACYKRRRNSWYDITHSGRVASFIAASGAHKHFYTSGNRQKKIHPTTSQEERPIRTEDRNASRKEA